MSIKKLEQMMCYTKNPFTFFFPNYLKLEKAEQKTLSEIHGVPSSPTQNFTTKIAQSQSSWPVQMKVPPTKTLKSNLKSLANFPDELPKESLVINHSEAS